MIEATQEEITTWEISVFDDVVSWVISYFENYKTITFVMTDKSSKQFKTHI